MRTTAKTATVGAGADAAVTVLALAARPTPVLGLATAAGAAWYMAQQSGEASSDRTEAASADQGQEQTG